MGPFRKRNNRPLIQGFIEECSRCPAAAPRQAQIDLRMGSPYTWRHAAKRAFPERCPSGLRNTTGNRVALMKGPWVRIPLSPLPASVRCAKLCSCRNLALFMRCRFLRLVRIGCPSEDSCSRKSSGAAPPAPGSVAAMAEFRTAFALFRLYDTAAQRSMMSTGQSRHAC